jgi:hypothetical protein
MLLISIKIIYFDYLHNILISNLETLTQYILPMPQSSNLFTVLCMYRSNIVEFYNNKKFILLSIVERYFLIQFKYPYYICRLMLFIYFRLYNTYLMYYFGSNPLYIDFTSIKMLFCSVL